MNSGDYSTRGLLSYMCVLGSDSPQSNLQNSHSCLIQIIMSMRSTRTKNAVNKNWMLFYLARPGYYTTKKVLRMWNRSLYNIIISSRKAPSICFCSKNDRLLDTWIVHGSTSHPPPPPQWLLSCRVSLLLTDPRGFCSSLSDYVSPPIHTINNRTLNRVFCGFSTGPVLHIVKESVKLNLC